MAFRTQTRLLKYGALIGGVQTPITEVITWTSNPGVVLETMDAIRPNVPANVRPAPADDWMYRIQWLMSSHILPDIRGVDPTDGRLVFDADFWETPAQQQANIPPLRRCTFRIPFSSKRVNQAGQEILNQINRFLLDAEKKNYQADYRDIANGGSPFPTTTDPALDPMGLLTNPQIMNRDGVYMTTPATWVP